MDIDTTAAMSFINNPGTHCRVAPLPYAAKHAVPTAGTSIALFKGVSPAQVKAAGEYINYLISDPMTVSWAEQTGYLPVRMSARFAVTVSLKTCALYCYSVETSKLCSKAGNLMNVFDFTVLTAGGTTESLQNYKGQVLLIVNTASK